MAAGGDIASIHSDMSVPRICIEGTQTVPGEEPMDSYTAGIELSNACRQFYVTRLKAANQVKQRLGLIDSNSSLGNANNSQSEPSVSSTDSLDYVVPSDHCGSPDLVTHSGENALNHSDPTLPSPASQERVQNLGVTSLSETKQGCHGCSRSQTGAQPSGHTPGSDGGKGVVFERFRSTQQDKRTTPQGDNGFTTQKGQGTTRWSSVQESMALLKREMVSELKYVLHLAMFVLCHEFHHL